MGAQISYLCGGEAAQEDLSREKTFEGKVKATPGFRLQEESVKKIQRRFREHKLKNEEEAIENRRFEREFDENVTHHGKFITKEEMEDYVSENVKKLEQELGPISPKEEEIAQFSECFTRGPILFNDDTIYAGGWNYLGKKEGFGTYIKADGSKYTGFWCEDKIQGRGRYIDKNGNYYEGSWRNGMANGWGVLMVSQGSRYEGNWLDDIQEGYGEETFLDGTSYKGEFKAGHKHGKGKFTWSDGSYYEGDFVNSVISGKGILHWRDGRQYSGQWQNNKMHGFGTFTWPDGKKYVGEYRNDKKEGHGIYYWSPEKYYDGQWMNSKQHGEGRFVLKGKVLKGQFRYGKIIKRYDEDKENVPRNVSDGTAVEKEDDMILDKHQGSENVDHDLHIEDKEHHLLKMGVGDTKSPLN